METYVLDFIENNYYGSMGEIPLYIESKLQLIKSNSIYKIKILAQKDITVEVNIVYFTGVIFNNTNFPQGKILNCSNLVTEEAPNATIVELQNNK